MTGFYLMHRGWMDNDAFENEPFSEREAWVWMIENARWESGTVNVLGSPVKVARGQFSHSLRFMADRFGWSFSKIRHFVMKLTKWQMISTDNSTGQLIVTICNYNKYQVITDSQQHNLQHSNDTATTQQQHKEEINKQGLREKEDVVTRARGENFFREIYDAGSEAFPYLATRHTEIINRWIEAGADPDRDVLPLFRQAKDRGLQPRSWNYFTQAVMDAIAVATAPLPKGKTNTGGNHAGTRNAARASATEAGFEGFAEAAGRRPGKRDDWG